ncbi:MAG: hypothetical protein J0I06_22560 [Planctomycetes bacterium]|nr:hypothetical protein [Planctomycetota bacterium]
MLARLAGFDCETTRIDDERPWLTPTFVLGAAFDGERGYFVSREHLAAFLRAHWDLPLVLHNAAFDLDVLAKQCLSVDVYAAVEEDRIWDTFLLHKLYTLATRGDPAVGKDEATLERCAEEYLGVALPKDICDSKGREVRTSYGSWLGRAPAEIEPVYLEYLAKDVIATRQVYWKLRKLIRELLRQSQTVWGFVSPEWLAECGRKWGPLTHGIQLRAAVALRAITANGMRIDVEHRDRLIPVLEDERDRLRTRLRKQGYLAAGEGSGKSLQTVFKRLESRHPGASFPRTEGGLYGTSAEALHDLVGIDPFVGDLLAYRAVDKLLGSFLDKLGRRTVHASFNVLARTGRTSSFGALNAQNLPKDERIRACFVPSPGHKFIDADYKTIELAALAQACATQFGLDSEMARQINAGSDLHRVFAAFVTEKPESEVSDDERAKVKPINFGKPGGMGAASLRTYAKVTYEIDYSDAEVSELSERWLELFPEMRSFLSDTVNTPHRVACRLGLTPAARAEHTDDGRMLRHPDNAGRANEPSEILGRMCLKVLSHEQPCTAQGKAYSPADLDFFWTRVGQLADELPEKFRRAIHDRTPSVGLQRSVASLVGRAAVFTLTGRLRANATYTARHNTIFQGLTSDGAKLGLWRVWRAGYRVVNFIHDQLLVEVPDSPILAYDAERIRAEMIAGMKEVIPDVTVDVDYAATSRWRKGAKAVFDAEGKLLVWEPPAKKIGSIPSGGAPSRRPKRQRRTEKVAR